MNLLFKMIIASLCTLSIFGAEPQPFALFTIPKSGSHLFIKALYFMTDLTPYWHTTEQKEEELFSAKHFPYTHCCLSAELFNHYTASTIKQILGIRDLRDVCVSIVYHIRKGLWPEFTGKPKKLKNFLKLSFDEQLLFVINQEYEISPPEVNLQLGIRKVAEQACELIKNPSILICRFEDLVGAKGGGEEQKQKELLKKIASHINISLTQEQIDTLANNLYGNKDNPFGKGDFSNYQSTFREGSIGAWKGAFKDIHKAAFKKRLGKQLIALGYEKDNNW